MDEQAAGVVKSAGDSHRAMRWNSRLFLISICLLISGMLWAASRAQGFVEQTYAETLGPAIAQGLGAVSGLVSVSVAEILLAVTVLWFTVRGLLGLLTVVRRRQTWRSALWRGLIRVLTFVIVVGTLFYALWGIQYARAPLPERMGWTALAAPEGAEEVEELEALCKQLVDEVNQLYDPAHAAGRLNSRDFGKIDTDLDQAYKRVTKSLGLAESFGTSRAPAKPIWASPIMSTMMLAGFYFPWTGEANYNADAPEWQRVQSIAHEKAHQRGITSEDEANFFGFLACTASEDPFVRYGGYLFAQRQLLRHLMRIDRTRGSALIAQRDPRVQADLTSARAFWLGHDGVVGKMSTTVNDGFLRVNKVKGGILSYGLSRNLLIMFARTRKGNLRW